MRYYIKTMRKTLTGDRIRYIVKYVIGADKSFKYKTSRR